MVTRPPLIQGVRVITGVGFLCKVLYFLQLCSLSFLGLIWFFQEETKKQLVGEEQSIKSKFPYHLLQNVHRCPLSVSAISSDWQDAASGEYEGPVKLLGPN